MNQDNVQKENKGVNAFLVFALSIFLIAVSGVIFWNLGVKYANLEQNNNDLKEENKDNGTNNSTDKESTGTDVSTDTENKPAKNEDYTFKQERSTVFNYTDQYAENVFNLVAYYYVDVQNLVSYDGTKMDYSVIRREIFVNGEAITEPLIIDVASSEKEINEAIEGDDIDSANPLHDTSNKDSYLVLTLRDANNLVKENTLNGVGTDFVNSYLINKSGAVVKKMAVLDSTLYLEAIFVNKAEIGDRKSYKYNELDAFIKALPSEYGLTKEETQYAVYANGNMVDPHDNYIYFVVNQDCDSYKEYKLTMVNGVVSEKHVKTYTGKKVLAAGQC